MTLLHQRRSPFQDIELHREDDGTLVLTLDGVYQFTTEDEAIFHEVLVEPAMVVAPNPCRVLILGGGDGLALRNVLRYPNVEQVVLCEIDGEVLAMTREVPAMIELTGNALADPRVHAQVGDARDLVSRPGPAFDVIICDFPCPTRPALDPLFATPFYRDVASRTHHGSVVSIQASLEPPAFWDLCDRVEDVFGFVEPRLVRMGREGDDDCWADFVLASRRAPRRRRPLADGLTFVTPAYLDGLVVRNRTGDRLVTDTYGPGPDFADRW